MKHDSNSDIAEFLTTRRANITPEQAGLPTFGPRRVPGLRREEVASLAGVSVEYYSGWSAATSAASPISCSKRSRAPCS